MNTERSHRQLAAILYADVVGYSRMTELDEESTLRNVRQSLDLFAATITNYHGRAIRYAGDSVLATFSSAVDALLCAARVQADIDANNHDLKKEQKVCFRIGINLGDIIQDGDDIFGADVNIAARLEALGQPGGICVSGAFYDAVAMKQPFDFEFIGEQHVKSISKPIRVYNANLKNNVTIPAPHETVQQTSKRKEPSVLIIALVVSLAVFLAGFWIYDNKLETPQAIKQDSPPNDQIEQTNDVPLSQPTIIVLPFDNLNNDPEQSYFVDGITEDIITDLSRLTNLRVLARNTSFSYKGKEYDLRQIHEELNVTHFLEGSVRKSGDQLRINTQLVESSTGIPLWAERYDRKLTDIFKVQDDVTQNIVTALSVHLTNRDVELLKGTSDQNFEAYDLFLQGRQALSVRTQEALQQAKELLTESIELDPNYSRAYGSLAIALIRNVGSGWSDTPKEDKDQALLLALKGTSLEDRSQNTYWSLGFTHLYRQEYKKAVTAAQKALQIAPNFADGYALLALINNYLGKPNDSIRLIKKAMNLNPYYSWDYLYNLGWAHYTLGEYEESVELLMQALDRNELARLARLVLIANYSAMGLSDEAEWEVDQITTQFPSMTLGVLSREAQFADANKMKNFLNHLRVAGFPE